MRVLRWALLSWVCCGLGGVTAAPYAPLAGEVELERELLSLSNDARQAAGVGVLGPDERLALAARHHAAEMAELSYFSHTSPVAANATLGRRVGPAAALCAPWVRTWRSSARPTLPSRA